MIFILAAAFLSFIFSSVIEAQEVKQGPMTSALPSAESIKTCMGSRNGAECMDNLFREALKEHSTREILQLIQGLGDVDPEIRRDCHPIVHAVGRETYRVKGDIHNSFSACDPKIAARYRFQCLHGLGHALLFFSAYKLQQSLEICDVLPEDWGRASCYGGVFMENVFNATPESRDLSPTDYHYPCNKLDQKYRAECYVMQTSRMTEMGLSTEKIFQECAKSGEFRVRCEISIGRDLSNDVRLGQIRATAQKCELASGEPRLACMRGVVYALIDNTWDGRYALPFCAALSQESDQSACYRESVDYLKDTFETPAGEITKECAKYLSQPKRCVELAAR